MPELVCRTICLAQCEELEEAAHFDDCLEWSPTKHSDPYLTEIRSGQIRVTDPCSVCNPLVLSSPELTKPVAALIFGLNRGGTSARFCDRRQCGRVILATGSDEQILNSFQGQNTQLVNLEESSRRLGFNHAQIHLGNLHITLCAPLTKVSSTSSRC